MVEAVSLGYDPAPTNVVRVDCLYPRSGPLSVLEIYTLETVHLL